MPSLAVMVWSIDTTDIFHLKNKWVKQFEEISKKKKKNHTE